MNMACTQRVLSRCGLRTLFSRLSLEKQICVPTANTALKILPVQTQSLHTTTVNNGMKWDKYNTIVYPPTKPGEEERPAEITHSRENIKYSPLKMWYIACMIRGMSIDEALKQLSFYKRKGSTVVKDVLLEAQEMAILEHGVEFKSNLWIADANATKGVVVKGLRKHRGPRYGVVHYKYCNFFVRLREGSPPKHYYPVEETGYEKLQNYLTEQRKRRIIFSL
ncbi:39S ribosomal protein L22, mitochondrial isoform X1 [Octopus sinensis]|nr:39S ribosomal protein L22, mitochondrial isoform X1 [Octopus sinensis]